MVDVEISGSPKIGLERTASLETRRPTTSWEKAYMQKDLQTAIDLTWALNRPLLDNDYAPLEQQAARETDPEKVAAQLVITDLTDERIQVEINRRTGLRNAFRDLSKIERTIDAFASPAVQERIEKETEAAINQRLAAINAERGKQTQESLSELPKDQREVIEIQERERIQAEYYDEENDIYYEIRDDGTPDRNKPVDLHATCRPVFLEIKQASEADPETSGLHPEVIAQAKHLRRTFDYNFDESKLVIPSKEQIRAKETLEMVYLGADVVEALLEPNGLPLFTRDESGNITGVNQEVLGALPLDASLVAMAQSLADFFKAYQAHPDTITDGQHNLATLLYFGLKEVEVGQLSDRPEFQATRKRLASLKQGDASFNQRATDLKRNLTENYLIPSGINIENVHEATQLMIYSLSVEALVKKDPTGEQATEFLEGLGINEGQRNAIVTFSKGAGRRALTQVFGFDVEALTADNVVEIYTNGAVEALEWAAKERGRPEFTSQKKEAYKAVVKKHFSNEKALCEFAKEHGPIKKPIYAFLLLCLFSGQIKALMDIDVSEEERGSRGDGLH